MGEETTESVRCADCSPEQLYWDKVSDRWKTLSNYWHNENLPFDSHAQKMCMELINRHTRVVRIDTTIKSKFRHFTDLEIGGIIETAHLDLEL